MQASESTKVLNVLVVDDVADSADTLATLIQMLGHSVRAAYTAAEGLRLAYDSVPDVIFHDLAMPGVNGFEAVRTLRRDARFASTIIVALSAYTTQVFIDDKHANFNLFFTKPISRDELCEILEMAAHRPGQVTEGR